MGKKHKIKISTSKIKNIIDTIKKGTEKDTVDLVSGKNPHSKGLPFTISEFSVENLKKKILIIKIVTNVKTIMSDK